MRSTTTWFLILVTLVLAFSIADGADAAASRKEDRCPDQAVDRRRPWMSRTLEADVSHQLQRAFAVAIQRIESSTSCAGLFQELGADPAEVLSNTLYFPARPGEERAICHGIGAFTTVGSPVTRLCRKFGSLRVHDAARLILHEALHHAGLPEGPRAADALNSYQINLLVAKSCSL